MKIKIHSLALDGPKCGTFGAAYATEREAWQELLRQISLSDDDAANALLEENNFGALEDLLSESTDGLTTWTVDENEIDFPGIMPLPLKPGFEDGPITTSEIKNIQVPCQHWDLISGMFHGSAGANGNLWLYCEDFSSEFRNWKTAGNDPDLIAWADSIIAALGDFDGDLCFFKE